MDWSRARTDTPACEDITHFNNAGASLSPQPVLNAVIEHLQLEASTGGYEAAERQQARIEDTYDAIAKLISCSRSEVAIIENATRAWDMAFYGMSFKAGDRILTVQSEYVSNYIAYLQVARKTGAIIEVIPDDEHGQVDVNALEQMIDDRVKLISITHVPTQGGLVNPAAAVGRIARAARIPYLLDACQSVGQMPINVEEIGCDALSATGRKFLRGPRGTGFLYVRQSFLEHLEPPMLDLHAARWVSRDRYELRPDARRFENWETYYAGKIGLGVAVRYALEWGLDNIWGRVSSLAEALRSGLNEFPGVIVCDLGRVRCGIVTFTVKGWDAKEIQMRMRQAKINVSVSVQEYARLDLEPRGLPSVVRASVHYYNSEAEIERFLEVLRTLIESTRA
jgi:cysteine desulfurase / selenocysteine lyase